MLALLQTFHPTYHTPVTTSTEDRSHISVLIHRIFGLTKVVSSLCNSAGFFFHQHLHPSFRPSSGSTPLFSLHPRVPNPRTVNGALKRSRKAIDSSLGRGRGLPGHRGAVDWVAASCKPASSPGPHSSHDTDSTLNVVKSGWNCGDNQPSRVQDPRLATVSHISPSLQKLVLLHLSTKEILLPPTALP